MKQLLGENKTRKVEQFTNRKVKVAYTRGSWPHYWAQVFFEGDVYTTENPPPLVNYKTGEVDLSGGLFSKKITQVVQSLDKSQSPIVIIQ